ncbi:MAG: ribosome small subunit-dependent GTPase A [Paludibacteraceae bacterium]|nr:ribosome small subunit-dependent GTPase A [Paludibacteraceae bacterium]
MQGLVVKNTGSWYQLRTAEGECFEAKIKGSFRMKKIRTTNPVAVGDNVLFEVNAEGQALISEILPRRNYIIRKASNLSKESHIIASNVDLSFLVVTLAHPETSTVFIDRFLATAQAYNVPVCLIFNKTDLYTDEERQRAENLIALYEGLGYRCFCTSALLGEGVESLKNEITGKITLFSGHSGVGKSSLIKVLLPHMEIKIGEISDYHQKGRHTTTFSEMYELPEGGYLIDTPGIKGFGTIEMKDSEIGHFFPEIFEKSRECRFGNCTHTHEPGCAVTKAVEEGAIAASRYQSFLSIMDDATESKYR